MLASCLYSHIYSAYQIGWNGLNETGQCHYENHCDDKKTSLSKKKPEGRVDWRTLQLSALHENTGDAGNLHLPAFGLYKWTKREQGEVPALEAVALTEQGRDFPILKLIDVGFRQPFQVPASRAGLSHLPPMAGKTGNPGTGCI